MSLKKTSVRIGAAVVLLLCASICRADLFTSVGNSREILRIDSTTGSVIRTYPFPEWIPGGAGNILGMAFDGRTLYMVRPTGGPPTELLSLDVVDNIWHPPSLLIDTFPPEPNALLSGLGFRRDEFGQGHLIATSLSGPPPPHSSIFEYVELFAGDPIQPWVPVSIPPGNLPAGIRANGADVDPATGDFWITALQTDSNGIVIGNPIMRVDLDGNVLETLDPNYELPVNTRGLGFDDGAMFVALREVFAMRNMIYEIDRTTGEILRSFQLPGTAPMGALTGGDVIPEPSTVMMLLFGFVGIAPGSRRRRRT